MRNKKELLWEKQNKALRHPSELFGSSFENAGITKDSLKFKASASFVKLLNQLKVTLVISREYENFLLALNAPNATKINQSFFHLPHPSGIAVDRNNNKMYVAATRNPNQIVEFTITKDNLERKGIATPKIKCLRPSRVKYYPGQYYFHDLVLGNGKLYANSVGMNCVLKIDLSNNKLEKPLWWPNCISKKDKPDTRANYIQLNSIAFNKTIEDSFFSASGSKISTRRPGQLNYPVDKKGVIFSGKTGQPVGYGLTRPHSARLYKNKIWVANSGYGEVGYIEKNQFKPVFKLNGWTRGLCFIDSVLFVGVSRVLPRFRHYAPGIKSKKQVCSIVAIDLKKEKVIGEMKFPYGNQVFAIEYFNSNKCAGFPFSGLQKKQEEIDVFSVSL